MSGKKCLVTGANGFLGSHLVEELLRQGHEVTCLVRKTSDLRWLEGLKVNYLHGDIAREPLPEAIGDFEIVFHTAGLIATKHPKEFYAVNRDGTARLITRFAELGARPAFVYVSSLAAAGPSPDGTPVTEESPPRPVSHYGRSKLEAEREVLKHAEQMTVAVVRPPVIYGPRDRGMLKFFEAAMRIIVLPGLREKRVSVLHVRDVVSGIIAAAGSKTGEVYFLASDRAYAWTELADAINRAVGRDAGLLRIPDWSLTVLAAVSSLLKLSPFLSLDKARELRQTYWVASADKAKRLLGWQETVDLATGVEETAEWYRQQGMIR